MLLVDSKLAVPPSRLGKREPPLLIVDLEETCDSDHMADNLFAHILFTYRAAGHELQTARLLLCPSKPRHHHAATIIISARKRKKARAQETGRVG